MSKIVRYEFLGSRTVFVVLCLTGIGIPLAVLYLLESLAVVHDDLQNPSAFLEKWRAENA